MSKNKSCSPGAAAEIVTETSSAGGGTRQTEEYCTGKVNITVHCKTEERSRTTCICIQYTTILNTAFPFMLSFFWSGEMTSGVSMAYNLEEKL